MANVVNLNVNLLIFKTLSMFCFDLFCFVFVFVFFRISSLNVIYDWITIFNMGYSKHQLSTINMLYLLKKNFVILHPYLPITVSSLQRPLSSILKVAVVERFSSGRINVGR